MAERCRICGEPATHSLGSYQFCDRHYERAQRQRGSLWRADLISVVALIAFVVIVYALDAALNPKLSGSALIVFGLIAALVPAAIWLVFFYRRDRLEPEPKGMVIGVFVIGALVAAAVGIPLVEDWFDVGSWLNLNLLTQIAGNVLVVGFVQMTLVYLAVRLSVYQSSEFDEWTDGILYGTAAGLGFATVLNIDFIAGSGGADLGLGTIRVALTALVLASLGGLVGYFLGHDRLEVRPVWYVPAGVALAAVLDGLYWFLRSSLTGGFATTGIPSNWIGLILAVILAVAVTWFLSNAVTRELRRVVKSGPSAQGDVL
ncbi:MAG: protease PrsW [Chloroflexota bacterium]|jgi:RsiW-degrading membrane proteinase PrsW (M82 family)|nr:protease PrsW [Chloroflexota bacterium]